MAHYPVNHPLRPVYRLVAGLIGLYFLALGVLGVGTNWGDPVFDRGGSWVLWLRTNLAFSVLAVLFGAAVLAAVVIGRNLYHRVTTVAGWALAVLAVLGLALLQTELNIFDLSMVNVIVLMVSGLLLITAGLYGRVQPPGEGHTGPGVGHRPVDKADTSDALPRPVRGVVDH